MSAFFNQLEELKRTSRILEIVQMITVAPRRYLRRDLASHFEVSERMIQKDLEIVRHGLKLQLVHSPEGYYLEEIPRLPSLQYSFSEALALLLAIQAARHVSGIRSAELAIAMTRLESLFPSEFIPMLRQLTSPPVRAAPAEHRQEMLVLLNQALIFRYKVEMIYETRSRGGEIKKRIVHPYYLMPYVRSWQMIAFCEKRQEILIFKVDRIHQATLLDQTYMIPEGFDPNEYLGQGWGLMRGSAKEPEDVVLHFDSSAGRWVAEEYWHSSQKIEEQPDGSLLFRLHVAITPEFVNWLLYYGARVCVEQPVWLRDQVKEAHYKAIENCERRNSQGSV